MTGVAFTISIENLSAPLGWKSKPHELRVAELQAEVTDARLKLFGTLAWWKLDLAKLNMALSKLTYSANIEFSKSDSFAPNQISFKIHLNPHDYSLASTEDFDNELAISGARYLLIEGRYYKELQLNRLQEKHPPSLTATLRLHCGHIEGAAQGLRVSCPDLVNFRKFKEPHKVFPEAWKHVCSLYKG